MIKCILKGLASAIAINMLNTYRTMPGTLLKIETAKAYVYGVRAARRLTIDLIRYKLLVGMVSFGVILFHAGLFVLLPWTVQTKALVGLCLGLVYVLYGAAMLRSAINEKKWLQKSGADRIVIDATKATCRRKSNCS